MQKNKKTVIQFCGFKALVDEGDQISVARLVQANRKASESQIITFYDMFFMTMIAEKQLRMHIIL